MSSCSSGTVLGNGEKSARESLCARLLTEVERSVRPGISLGHAISTSFEELHIAG